MSTIFDEGDTLGSAGWKDKMLANGTVLKNHSVRQVLLVHGTFAGDNALGLFDFFEPIEQSLKGSTDITDKLKVFGKSVLDQLVEDVGNYTPHYAAKFREGLNNEILCDLFIWGSGNFHLARLKGTLELAQKLANIISSQNIKEADRILLIGHSHAGQLFALLTTFLENGQKAQQLYEIVEKSGRGNKEQLLSHLEKIKTVNLDIVTFGTPVRYSWGEYNKYQLLAIVNHRSPVDISGLLTTRDGDYVQQWGAEGTDVWPPVHEKELNDALDALLDKGRDLSALKDSLDHKDRKHPHHANGETASETLLIDYKDNAPTVLGLPIPLDIKHCVKTLFGHGVYTETRAMLFNINTIIENFYRL